MLAAKKQLGEVKSDDWYREFVLDVNASIPKKFNLFYWVYPFENTIILRILRCLQNVMVALEMQLSSNS